MNVPDSLNIFVTNDLVSHTEVVTYKFPRDFRRFGEICAATIGAVGEINIGEPLRTPRSKYPTIYLVSSTRSQASSVSSMMFSVTRVSALLSLLATYFLRRNYGCSWFWAIPLYSCLFINFHMLRMFVYERYFSPLAKLPGPKVCLS